MPTIDYDPMLHFNMEEADKALVVKFFSKPMQNPKLSLAEGHPVFEDKDYISIDTPGNKLGGIVRVATDHDKQRFAGYWHAYINRTGQDEKLVGMPLVDWTLITRAEAETLAYFKIRTVEQLANVSDGNSNIIMGFYDLKRRAKNWVEAAAKDAPLLQMQEELRQRDLTIGALEHSLKLLGDQVQAMQGIQSLPAVQAPAPVAAIDPGAIAAMIQQQVAAALAGLAPSAPVPPKNKGGRPRVVKTQPAD